MASKTTEQLRDDYRNALRGLCYDNAKPEHVRARVDENTGEAPTPEDYVKAIHAVTMPCRRCAGTGRFVTYVENGKPRGPGGECFRCGGKGYQDHEDGHRNRKFDLWNIGGEAHAMMR